MPCESNSYDAALYFYDGVNWKLLSHVRCDDDCSSIWKDEETKVEEEQKVPDERFERDLSNLKKKLKNKFYEQGYLTVGDMIEILHLNVNEADFNPYILYTGDTKLYRNAMENLAIKKYRTHRSNINNNKYTSKEYLEFQLINRALDDLENTKQQN